MTLYSHHTHLHDHHFLVGGANLRAPHLHIVPYVSCKLESELPPLHLGEDPLFEATLQSGEKLVVVH